MNTELSPDVILMGIRFEKDKMRTLFNFEKVS